VSFDKANIRESRIGAALLVPAGKASHGAACQVCAIRQLQPLLLFFFLSLDLSSHASNYKEMMQEPKIQAAVGIAGGLQSLGLNGVEERVCLPIPRYI